MDGKHTLRDALLLIAAFIVTVFAHAQTYPARPVRMVAPYPPGSSADIIGRIYAPRLSTTLGQQFIVDNRAGAFGNIAADLLAVNPSLPVKSTQDLIAFAKARPGKLTYAFTGTGGALHLTMQMFQMETGINMLHVPYKGSSTSIPDLIGGRVDTMFGSAPSLLPHVRAGRIRALGISSAKRSAAAPDLPTIAESGLPGFEAVTFAALAAPAATPSNILALLGSALAKAAQSPEISSALANQSTELAPMTPQQTAAFIGGGIAKWKKVVTAAGVQAE